MPVQLGTAKETFKQLCAEFNVSEHVGKACWEAQWQCRYELRFAFAEEVEMLPWVKAILN